MSWGAAPSNRSRPLAPGSVWAILDPEPGPGQVLVKMKASSICRDLQAMYRLRAGSRPLRHTGA